MTATTLRTAADSITERAEEMRAAFPDSSEPAFLEAVAEWLWEAANHEEIHGDLNCKAACLHPTCRVADRARRTARAWLEVDA